MEGIYNRTIVNEVYPEAIMVAAMRIWSLPKGKEHLLQKEAESGKYFGQIKKDGYFYEFNRTENHCYLFSRNESKQTGLLTEKLANVPHIEKALGVLPKDTIVIGEIYIPGKTSKDVTRIMGCLPPTAVKRQNEEGLIHFYLHDIIAFNGVSMMKMGAMKRYQILKKVVETYDLLSNNFIELAESYTDNLFERIGAALESGEEGMVLKAKEALYTPGKKPAWSAIKCKKVDYVDVVCMGFEDATKEYTGTELENWQYWENVELGTLTVGSCYGIDGYNPITKPYYNGWKTSIIIGAYDNEGNLKKIGTVSSGLTDDMKIKITNEPNKYIGQTMMVQCMEKDAEAMSLRHPIFKGFREDKSPSECTIAEIF